MYEFIHLPYVDSLVNGAVFINERKLWGIRGHVYGNIYTGLIPVKGHGESRASLALLVPTGVQSHVSVLDLITGPQR